ncbi:MAG: hypothetical protein SGARI_000323 [Bacillariaceae sp.]
MMGAFWACAFAKAGGNPVPFGGCFFGLTVVFAIGPGESLLARGAVLVFSESDFLLTPNEAGFLVGDTLILLDLARCFIPLKGVLTFLTEGESVLTLFSTTFGFPIALAAAGFTADSAAHSFWIGLAGKHLSLVCCFHLLFSRAPQLLDLTLTLDLEGVGGAMLFVLVLTSADGFTLVVENRLLDAFVGDDDAIARSTSLVLR